MDVTRRQLLELYAQGYAAGHHDTVESTFDDVHAWKASDEELEYYFGEAIDNSMEDME